MNFVLMFFFLVVFFSSAELLLLLKVAANLGFFATFALCALTGILGGALVRAQGLATLRGIQESAARGELPAEEVVGGFMLIITGALLMVPGFITDTMGFLMLVPFLRRKVARKLIDLMKANVRVYVGPMGQNPPGETAHGDAIETEAVKHSQTPEDDPR